MSLFLVDAEIAELPRGQQLPGLVGDVHLGKTRRLAPAADTALSPDGAAVLVFQKMQITVLGNIVPPVGVDSGTGGIVISPPLPP